MASKSELNPQLAQKANFTEVTGTIAEIAQASSLDLKQEISLLNIKFEDIQGEFAKKSSTYLQHKNRDYILAQLEFKANVNDVNEALEAKANKASFSNVLHLKTNKVDIENQFVRKQDIVHLRNLLDNIDGKAEYSSIENILQILHNKVDKFDFTQYFNSLDSRWLRSQKYQFLKNEFSSPKNTVSHLYRQLGIDKIHDQIHYHDKNIQILFQRTQGGIQSEKVLQNLDKKCEGTGAYELKYMN